MTIFIGVLLIIALALGVAISTPRIRKKYLSKNILKLLNRFLVVPKFSHTEQMAIEAGKVGPEKEFFKGHPNFQQLRNIPATELTTEEKYFIYDPHGPVEKLCRLTNDFQSWTDGNLSQEVWDFLKESKFFGMIIPKKFGGLGFSHFAHSEIIMKLSSRSISLAVTTMVPSSLGPAELLLNYGTSKQKNYYLPRLASGRDIPCFGLTEPEAGSDATNLSSSGIVFKSGDKIKIRLSWNKRWITLGPIATLIGIAFKLKDPQHLISEKEDLGITCALVPSDLPGVEQGDRHDPLGLPIFNGPIFGRDVEIDLDHIIGGKEYIGKGWMMIAESLSAGRGISLPSLATGSTKLASSTVAIQSNLRHQFSMPIGQFEGVKTPLANIFGKTYLIDSTRKQVITFMEAYGVIPVVSAIAKSNLTQISREVINDAMDILGGQGISRGPKNLLANTYIIQPIGITVEGANILTRTLMIFGQGVMRAHPHIYGLVKTIQSQNLEDFDKSFWAFSRHLVVNFFATIRFFFTRAFDTELRSKLPHRRHYQKLRWASARFAFFTDMAMIFYGAKLKKKEALSGRFADLLSWQLIAFSVLRNYELSGSNKSEQAVFNWGMKYCFYQIQKSFEGLYLNFNHPAIGWWTKTLGYVLLQMNPIATHPSDSMSFKMADKITSSRYALDSIRHGMYLPTSKSDPHFTIEMAYKLYDQTRPLYAKLLKTRKSGKISASTSYLEALEEAHSLEILSLSEYQKLREVESYRLEALSVDFFKPEFFESKNLGVA